MTTAMMQRRSEEWERAWELLATAYGSRTCRHPDTGETWQYMGSAREGGTWFHHFRHRTLPTKDGNREDTRIEAAETWEPEEVYT